MLRLKEILKEKGMSGKELANHVNVTPASISNIINGNHFPKPELLKDIADALDKDIRELFVSTKKEESRPVSKLFIQHEGEYIQIGTIDLDYKIFNHE